MQAPPHVAPEDTLEWFFDNYIADTDPVTVDEDEERSKEEKDKDEPLLKENKTEDSSSQNAAVQSPGPVPDIVNVVCTASLGCDLDLNSIALRAKNVELHHRRRWLRMRLKSPPATAVFSTFGRMMCNGVNSVEEAHTASRRFARIIQKLGCPVHFSHFRVHNLSVVYCSFPVSLERLHVALLGNCSYEPELFRGLFYKHSSKITACVFATGTVTLTGSKHLCDFEAALRSISPALRLARIHRRRSLSQQ